MPLEAIREPLPRQGMVRSHRQVMGFQLCSRHLLSSFRRAPTANLSFQLLRTPAPPNARGRSCAPVAATFLATLSPMGRMTCNGMPHAPLNRRTGTQIGRGRDVPSSQCSANDATPGCRRARPKQPTYAGLLSSARHRRWPESTPAAAGASKDATVSSHRRRPAHGGVLAEQRLAARRGSAGATIPPRRGGRTSRRHRTNGLPRTSCSGPEPTAGSWICS